MTNYRTTTFLLAGLLLIAIAAIVWLTSKDDKNDATASTEAVNLTDQQLQMLDFLYADDFLKSNPSLVITSNTGEFIPQDVARAKMDTFKIINQGNKPKPVISPFAFAFGTKRVQRLIDQINSANASMSPTSPEDSIQGVRIYLTSTIKPGKRPHLDLLFVPVKGNGEDFLQVGILNDPDDDMLLNTSSPCPEVCN